MANSRGQTVGDMIVANRKASIKELRAKGLNKQADEIAALPAPRSIRNESWPPRR